MRLPIVMLLVVACVKAPSALTLQPAPSLPAVGFVGIEGHDPVGSKPLKMVVMYPTAVSQTGVTDLGPYRLEAQAGVDVADGRFPLVVISHGHAGSRFGHHDLAEHLARAGYVVAALEHAGDSWADQTAFGTDRAMYGRAYQVSAAIDAVLADVKIGPHVDANRIGIAGFSAGGYTALTVIGARPNFSLQAKYCERHPDDDELCQVKELKRTLGDLRVMKDPRVKAAYLMAPLGLFFGAEAFDEVTAPVFLTWADHDVVLLPDEHAELVKRGLGVKLAGTRVVSGAGHFVFMAPCTAELASDAARLCEDPVGVDRVAVHRAINTEAAAFFSERL